MPENTYKVDTFTVTYTCDFCLTGEMKIVRLILTINPPNYLHVCSVCGILTNLDSIYPRIEYVPSKED